MRTPANHGCLQPEPTLSWARPQCRSLQLLDVLQRGQAAPSHCRLSGVLARAALGKGTCRRAAQTYTPYDTAQAIEAAEARRAGGGTGASNLSREQGLVSGRGAAAAAGC